MTLVRTTTRAGQHAIDAIAANPEATLVAFDYDGTLAPIVDDPEQAFGLPAAMDALGRLGSFVGQVAIITGREITTVVRLGGLAERPGLERLVVLGQYGVERWDAATDEFSVPAPPAGIVEVERELPAVLADAGVPDATVEHKKRAIGVHTRRLPDAAAAFEALEKPLVALANRHSLTAQAGKYVWEIKAADSDKGSALRKLQAETGARLVVYAGDDLGDIEAFRALEGMRSLGIAGVAVCSASDEQEALVEHADVVCEGPEGIAEWLNDLVTAIEAG